MIKKTNLPTPDPTISDDLGFGSGAVALGKANPVGRLFRTEKSHWIWRYGHHCDRSKSEGWWVWGMNMRKPRSSMYKYIVEVSE